MSIHRTKQGKYEVRYREGSRHRSKTFDLRSDAREFEAATRLSKQRGERIIRRKDSPTFSQCAREYMDRREILGKATKTLLFNAGCLDNHILPYIGHLPMVDVNIGRLEDWQQQALKDGSTPYMLNRSRELIGQISKYAVKRGYMAGNPVDALEILPHRVRKGQVATIDQIEQMREYLLSKDRLGYATLISVLAYQGTRPSEALALRWDHLQGRQLTTEQHLADGEIVGHTKTGRDRHPNVPSPVLADLAEWKLACGRIEGLIFPRADGLAWRDHDWRNWSKRWFKSAAGEAGLLTFDEETGRWEGGFRPYDLRHTCASLKIRAGVPPATIAAEMGHSLEVLFRVYGHEIEAMKGHEVMPIDQSISEIRSARVRKMFDRKAS